MMVTPVIDTHFHLGVNPLTQFSEDELLTWMDDGRIDIQFVMGVNEGFVHRRPDWNPYLGNDYIAEVQRRHPDRVVGLGMVNPWLQPPPSGMWESPLRQRISSNEALDEVDRAIGELGLRGFKMHPYESHYQINNPHIVWPVLARLLEWQRRLGKTMVVVTHAAGDTLNNSPEAVADTAAQFPELLFVAFHSGYRWATPTVTHTMAAQPNVLLDLTTAAATGLLQEAYGRYGPTKFSAGSDGPFATVAMKNAIVESLTGGDPEATAMILGGNLAQRLGL
jgi:predicted TIM-barrel fold metal-dependent hydrolase